MGQPTGHGRPPSIMKKRSASTLTEEDAPKKTAHVLTPAPSAAVEAPTQPPTAHFAVPPPERRSKHPTTYATAHTTSHSRLASHSPQHYTNASPHTQLAKHTLQHPPPLAYYPTPLHLLSSHQLVHIHWHHSLPTSRTGTSYITLHMASTSGSPLATQVHTPLDMPPTSSLHWLVPTSSRSI